MNFWSRIIGNVAATNPAAAPGNPLDALPEQSRRKLERLQDERSAARAVLHSRSDALMELREQHGRAQGEAQRALENLPAPPRGTTAEEMVARIEADGNRHKAELDRAIERHKAAEAAVYAFDFLSDIETWLNRFSQLGGLLEHQPLPKPTLGVPAVRAKLADLDRAWSETENAPVPRDDYKTRALAEVNAIADAGRLAIDMRHRGPNPLGLLDRLSVSMGTVVLPPLAQGGAPDRHVMLHGATEHAAFLAWLHRDAIVARVEAEIENADDIGALSHEARETRFKKLAEQRLALNLAEEAAIVGAANTGQTIPRRRDADPRAILEVKEV